MDPITLMAIFSALALGNCLFLAFYFWAPIKKSPNRFFMFLLLLSLSIRIIKSILTVLVPDTPNIIPAVGLIGLTMIGPSLFFYAKSFRNSRFELSRKILVHFFPAIFLALVLSFLEEREMFFAYVASVFHMLFYVSIAAHLVFKNNRRYKEDELWWFRVLLAAILIIWLTFFAQLIIEIFETYLVVTVVASIAIYGLCLVALKKKNLFKDTSRKFSQENLEALKDIATQTVNFLRSEQLFKDSFLTIKTVSSKMGHKDYLISQAINHHFNMSFPELLNEIRVEHATDMISSKKYGDLAIEGIAYESGYNSISAFYRAFKKIKGTTPANYKKSIFQ